MITCILEHDGEHFTCTYNMTFEEFTEIHGELPKEIISTHRGEEVRTNMVVAFGKENKFFNKFRENEIGRFKPIVQDGKLIDVEELEPIVVELTKQNQINISLSNLRNTDYHILRSIESILPDLHRLVGKELPKAINEISLDRNEWRANINILEEQIQAGEK